MLSERYLLFLPESTVEPILAKQRNPFRMNEEINSSMKYSYCKDNVYFWEKFRKNFWEIHVKLKKTRFSNYLEL